MSLIQSAKLNGLDPYEYLRDVLTRLPKHKACRIAELLSHKWAGVRQGGIQEGNRRGLMSVLIGVDMNTLWHRCWIDDLAGCFQPDRVNAEFESKDNSIHIALLTFAAPIICSRFMARCIS